MTVSGSQFPLVRYGFSNVADINSALAIQEVSKDVENIQKTYRTINVKAAMSNFIQVGQLLQLAYAGSKGHKCSEKIVQILIDYQPLVNNSMIACETFVQSSLMALKYQMVAIKIGETKGLSDAMKIISKCAELAGKMAGESKKLVDQSQQLWNLSKEALVVATQDENLSYVAKKDLEKNLADMKAQEEVMKKRKADLTKDIKAQKEKEKEAAKKADKQQQKAFVLSLVSTFMKPLQVLDTVGKLLTGAAGDKETGEKNIAKEKFKTIIKTAQEEHTKRSADLIKTEEELAIKKVQLNNKKKENGGIEQVNKLEEEVAVLEARVRAYKDAVSASEDKFKSVIDQLNIQADNYLQQEAKAAKTIIDLRKLKREANSSLAESVIKLQHMNKEKDELGKAIRSLEVTVKTLGKVIDTFEDTRIYWEGIEKQCQALTDKDIFQIYIENDMKDDFMHELQGAAIRWLSLAKINLEARNAMENVKEFTSSIIKNLPTKEEADKLIDKLSKEILAEISEPILIEEL